MSISKAQEVRNRQNAEYINFDLRRKLAEFENGYLNSCVAYEFNSRKLAIKQLEKLIEEFPTRESYTNRFGRDDRPTVRDYQSRIDRIQNELKFDATITMTALVVAKKSYDLKVNKVVETLIEEGFRSTGYKVLQIKSEKSTDLSFLISKEDKEVHARIIWVNGVEVTPHFRFITTTRKIS